MPLRGPEKERRPSLKLQRFWKKKSTLYKLRRAFAMMIAPEKFAFSNSSPSVTRETTMSSMKPDQNAMSSETSDESLEEENILKRVSSLPLVCSVCDLVSSNYTSIKRKNSYLQTVCDGAEKGMKTLTGAAVSRAQPLLNSLEPQLATANKYVCRGLDTMEQKVPILQQRADQVVSGTKELMTSKVTDAKNAVTRRLSGMVGMTKDVVQNGVKTTASLVSSSMTVVMGTRMGKMAKNSVETVLGRSHAFIDHYLLISDEDLMDLKTCSQGTEMDPVQEVQTQIKYKGYLACMLSLLNKFQRYISKQSWYHLRNANESLQIALENTFSEWKGWLIALYYTITLPLRTIYLILLFTVEELSAKFNENVPQACYILEDLKLVLSALTCLQELCWKIFARVWEKMSEEENLNTLLNYIVQTLPFCFFANHCKCRTSTDSTAKALKAIQRVQASRDSLLGLEGSGISSIVAAT
ncbi:perilipin-3-like isoform X2 [Crotalus tigris]|uniref:perilipin-3-like isoform X2 n=1 Tax=Crotalus tigris TaxID=88082 RepID=UPI00192F1275|nr:perilipin-3-like isoform X2 [Crotalus tigris]